ncbi:Xaa-Pro aminopeptidase [Aequitasia blattaphilus]
MLEVADRIRKLRELMKEAEIDFYIVPTADFHQSEYVGEYFKARKFMTGFTGSAGTIVVSREEVGLWVDGRYFIQAANQIKGAPITLFKMGEPGVPTINEYLETKLKEGEKLGFDGRVVSMSEGLEYEKIVQNKKGHIVSGQDLVDKVWENRPPISEEVAFALDEKYTGESVSSKLKRIRKKMSENKADAHILNTIDDICWTLNIRGNDIEFFPLVLSYGIIYMGHMDLYIDEKKLDSRMKEKLKKENIFLHPYNSFYEAVKNIAEGKSVMLDPAKINYATFNNIPRGVEKVEENNPEILFKSMKNEVEVENIRQAQIKDSVCYVKFMKWLKENYEKGDITELSASAKLDELRNEQKNYIRPSFAPICAYGPHSASPHYESSPKTDVVLEAGNFFLADTGAGFLEGSTDITRTYALGEVSQDKKEDFTLVAVSNLRLASAKFLYGSTGMVLDILARKPFWDRNINFNHGTGHGVGYLLGIHEGPSGFRWNFRSHESHQLEAGMVITNEPGIYYEGSHGVRLENELLVCNGEKNEYGQFMYLEPITYIPFDIEAIEPKIMTQEDKTLLNDYHKLVFEKISPFLDEEEKVWLEKFTREVE